MRVVIAGGHGQIAQLLIKALAAQGDTGVGLVRSGEHVAELEAIGGEAVVVDLELATPVELQEVLAGADAVVFAAGSGGGDAARTDAVDRGAAELTARAAELAGVRRYVQVSSFGAGEEIPADTPEGFVVYLQAKTAAEQDLMSRGGLDWTILRPGGLTDADATGLVALSEPPLARGDVPRADVAHVLLALLKNPGTAGKVLMLTSGATELPDAVAAHAG